MKRVLTAALGVTLGVSAATRAEDVDVVWRPATPTKTPAPVTTPASVTQTADWLKRRIPVYPGAELQPVGARAVLGRMPPAHQDAKAAQARPSVSDYNPHARAPFGDETLIPKWLAPQPGVVPVGAVGISAAAVAGTAAEADKPNWLPATLVPPPAAVGQSCVPDGKCCPPTVNPPQSFGMLQNRPAENWVSLPTAAPPTPAERFFVRGEYLLWLVRNGSIPVLATAGNDFATSPTPNFGFLGRPGTVPVIGPGDFGESLRSGFRVRGGVWLDDCQTCGLDGSVFLLGRRGDSAAVASNGNPVITRPFFAANQFPNGLAVSPNGQVMPGTPGSVTLVPPGQVGAELGEFVSSQLPTRAVGALRVETDSMLWGADINARKNLCGGCWGRADWFVGFRYLDLGDNLRMDEVSTLLNQPQSIGVVSDHYQTRNQFYGGQVGLVAERFWGRFVFDVRPSIALGVTHQTLNIHGTTTQLAAPNFAPNTVPGGLYAVPSKIGSFRNDEFSVAPEINANIGYQVTPWLRVFGGYNFLYWTNVIRAGDQVDRVVDIREIPFFLSDAQKAMIGPPVLARQNPLFRQTDFWAHGINLGMQMRW